MQSDSRAIDRLCHILNSFTEADAVLTLTEISARNHLPKSTTHRFLRAMVSQGLLVPDPGGRGYRPGFQLIHWGMLSQSTLEVRRMALPILRRLTSLTGETSVLVMRFGDAGICVELVESSQPVRLALKIGQTFPFHASACAKVLLAFLPDEEIEAILSRVDRALSAGDAFPPRQPTRMELETIREHGYATSVEETQPGVFGAAAPVFDSSENGLAAIGILVPEARVRPPLQARWVMNVQDAAGELSRQMGGPLIIPIQLVHLQRSSVPGSD